MDPLSDYGICAKMHDLGFPRSMKPGSLYYLGANCYIEISEAEAIKDAETGHTVDYDKTLIFKPRIEELEKACEPFLTEIRRMSDGSLFAYSNVKTQPEPTETNPDPFIRAQGADL